MLLVLRKFCEVKPPDCPRCTAGVGVGEGGQYRVPGRSGPGPHPRTKDGSLSTHAPSPVYWP